MIASGSSRAQSSQTTIYYNHETPQLQFAASKVRAAVAAKSGRLVERALSEFNLHSDATAFVIAVGDQRFNAPLRPPYEALSKTVGH
jgi:hypothetical protein